MLEYEEYYDIIVDTVLRYNVGNCKKCVNKFSCGNKNKQEADRCDKYRPVIKKKRGKKRK